MSKIEKYRTARKTFIVFAKNFKGGRGVKLKSKEKTVVHQTIITEAERTSQQVEALAVCSNRVHLVVRWSYHPIGEIVSRYKNAAMSAPGNPGRSGRIWTRGYDKRFCFTENEIARGIKYVKKHQRQDDCPPAQVNTNKGNPAHPPSPRLRWTGRWRG